MAISAAKVHMENYKNNMKLIHVGRKINKIEKVQIIKKIQNMCIYKYAHLYCVLIHTPVQRVYMGLDLDKTR